MGIFDFLKKKTKTSDLIKEEIPFYKKIAIDLQNKTQAEKGTVEKYWFENEHSGIKKTLIHKIRIPLKPFNSGFEYESQPVETLLVIDFLNLNLLNPNELDGLVIKKDKESDIDASVYVGNVYNVFDIYNLTFKKVSENEYQVNGDIMVDFENEMTAKNENFNFNTTVEFKQTD